MEKTMNSKKSLDKTTKKSSIKDEFLIEFPWAGNLGQWKWYYQKNDVLFNDLKAKHIGYDPNEIGKIGFEFFTSKLHPEDYDRVMNNMMDHLKGITLAYEVEYRIKHKDGHYLWYYDRGKVTKRDENHVPILIEGIVFDITESKKIEQQLRDLSQKDSLTNVFNRRSFYEYIDKEIIKHDTSNIPFSLIMFDIDHFKAVNDTFGHLVGDDVLVSLTQLLMLNKRIDDQIFRFGGEEFFLLLPHTIIDDAITVASRCQTLINEMVIPKVGGITVSMGVVEHVKHETIDQMITRVDNLMYLAKHSGRNQIKYE